MVITREQLVERLSEKSEYYKQDVRKVLQALDEVLLEYFNEATLDEEGAVQIAKGIKCGVKIVGARERVDPRTQKPIIVSETVKPFARFSTDYKNKIQKQYDEKTGG